MATVYVIGAVGLPQWVKVGSAVKPEQRLTELQTGSPVELVLHGTVADLSRYAARALEAWTHRELADKRVRGEWFRVSPAVALATVERGLETIGSQWSRPVKPPAVRHPPLCLIEDDGIAADRELSRQIALLGKGQWAARADL